MRDRTIYSPNSPAVVSETVDGESIIMHHGTGYYFDAVGSGMVLWEAIAGGACLEELVARLTSRFEVSDEMACQAAQQFIEALQMHDLLREGAAERTAPAGPVHPAPARARFQMPELGVHTDLADMLLLDPIHDVGETGWPSPPRAMEADRAR